MSMAGGWTEPEFEAIFREYYPRIAAVTRRVLRCDSQAEEVCAEVFLRLYRGGPGVASAGQVGGWLYRTATRASIDVLRSARRRGFEESFEESNAAFSEQPSESPLTQMLRGERIAQARAVLAKIHRQKAQILLLRYDGLSYREIADAMQIRASSVGTMLARAEAEFSMRYERNARRGRKTPQWRPAKEGQ